jgi:hypothetical protein
MDGGFFLHPDLHGSIENLKVKVLCSFFCLLPSDKVFFCGKAQRKIVPSQYNIDNFIPES